MSEQGHTKSSSTAETMECHITRAEIHSLYETKTFTRLKQKSKGRRNH